MSHGRRSDDGSAGPQRITQPTETGLPRLPVLVFAAGGRAVHDNSIGQIGHGAAAFAEQQFSADARKQHQQHPGARAIGHDVGVVSIGDHTGDFLDDTSDTPNEAGDGCTAAGADSRQSSDMSMDANPGTGYAIYFTGAGKCSVVPASWPRMAGLFANLTTSGRPCGFRARADLLRAQRRKLFRHLPRHHSGSNGKFSADTGWDHPTGWGTPDASEFIAMH